MGRKLSKPLALWQDPRETASPKSELFKDGDVIVAVDGQPVPTDESHFMALVD